MVRSNVRDSVDVITACLELFESWEAIVTATLGEVGLQMYTSLPNRFSGIQSECLLFLVACV